MARLDERSPPVSFAIPDARVFDGCGEVLERLSSGGHVVDLHLCARRATAQQGGDFEKRRVGDVVHSRPRRCRERCRDAQQPLVRHKQLLDAAVVGSQKRAISKQRLETARPPRRSNPAPQRTQRKHRAEPDRSSTTDSHDRRQRRHLSPDDRSGPTHDKDNVNRPRPAIVRFSEDVVEQFVDLIATTLKIPDSNERARPRRNDHGRPEVDIGLLLVHNCESIRKGSKQPRASSTYRRSARCRCDPASGSVSELSGSPPLHGSRQMRARLTLKQR